MVAPWVWHMVYGYLLPKHIEATAIPLLTASEIKQTIAIYYAPVAWEWLFSQVIRPFQALLACLGVLVGMIIYRRLVVLLLSWFGLLFILNTPDWTGLPYVTAVYNNFSVAIALYLVSSILIAILVTCVVDLIATRCRAARPILLIAAVIVACILASRWQPSVLNPDQVFVTPADETAAQWISAHLPVNAEFAIRPHFSTPIEAAGIDGGYWLPYLTGRRVTIPPMVYFSDGDKAYVNDVIQFLREWREMRNLSDFVALLKSRNIPYVYIGPRNPDDRRQILRASSQFEVIYDRDDVTIFRLR
jgi:hypothetical protein